MSAPAGHIHAALIDGLVARNAKQSLIAAEVARAARGVIALLLDPRRGAAR